MSIRMSPALLESAIKSIAKAGKKLDTAIQDAAVSAAAHFEEHGDIVFVNKLFLALPAGARKSALALWFITFTKAIPNTDAKSKAGAPFSVDKAKTFNVAEGEATQWFDLKKEPEIAELFDVQKALGALIAKAKKSAKTTDAKLLATLESLTKGAPSVIKSSITPPAVAA
jgi:hypothetical protein